MDCWLKSVLHGEKCRTGSYSGAGEQTQKKNVGQAPTVERANKRKKKSVGQAPTAERVNKRKKRSVGRHPTLEQNGKIIMSDEVRCRIGKG